MGCLLYWLSHRAPQPISVEILPSWMTPWQNWRCQNLPNRHLIRHKNNCCCVWIPWSSYNTTVYTMGLCYERKHGVVKVSNFFWTSTTDTEQKGWLNWPRLMHPFSWVQGYKPLMLASIQPAESVLNQETDCYLHLLTEIIERQHFIRQITVQWCCIKNTDLLICLHSSSAGYHLHFLQQELEAESNVKWSTVNP